MIREAVTAILLFQTVPPAPVLIPAGTHAYSMPSQSMRPTVEVDEVLLADRRGHDCGTTTPAPGDVVIIDRDGDPWVKRVVAGPGQTVEIAGGALSIDGAVVTREVVGTEEAVYGLSASRVRETLPNGVSYLTLDYGPDHPRDYFGPITLPDGHWFTLGDNRDNSIDGRDYGPTPSSRLCGKAIRIIRSANPERVGALLSSPSN